MSEATETRVSEAQHELGKVLRAYVDVIKQISRNLSVGIYERPPLPWEDGLMGELMRWHDRHSGQRREVTREQIEGLILDLQGHEYHAETPERSLNCSKCMKVIDGLVALLTNGTGKERVWCSHWLPNEDKDYPWARTFNDGTMVKHYKMVTADIKFCDQCGAPRPKED